MLSGMTVSTGASARGDPFQADGRNRPYWGFCALSLAVIVVTAWVLR